MQIYFIPDSCHVSFVYMNKYYSKQIKTENHSRMT